MQSTIQAQSRTVIHAIDMFLLTALLCLPLLFNNAAYSCDTSSFTNVRAVFSGKSKEDPTDIIVNDCVERNDATKNFYTLELTNQNVEKLRRGAIANLTVTTLILSNNRIREIEKHAFLNLKSAQTVDLSRNKLTSISRDVFNDMVSLKTLDLSSNRIEQMEDEIFAHMVSLQELKLNFNKLKVWNPNWFANNMDMNKLEVEGNLLETLPEKSFRDMEKLSSLVLRGNSLREIHQNAFEGLATLKYLDLAENKLMKLHPETFAPFSGRIDESQKQDRFSVFSNRGYNPFAGLWDLYIHNNNLTYFAVKMMEDLVNTRSLSTFSFHSNPWQCGCYMKMVRWADKNRLRLDGKGKGCYRRDNPVCVVPTRNPQECVEEVEGEDIRALYFSKFKVPVNNFFDRNVVCNMF